MLANSCIMKGENSEGGSMRIRAYEAIEFDQVPEEAFWELDGFNDSYMAGFVNYPPSKKLVVTGWATTGEWVGELATALVVDDHIVTCYTDQLSIYDGTGEQLQKARYYDMHPELAEESDEDAAREEELGLSGDEDDFIPPAHYEPPLLERLARLLQYLRKRKRATWLVVHDADELAHELNIWPEQGFQLVPPPPDIAADDAVIVYMWGELPKDIYALLRERGLSWNLNEHRGFVKRTVEQNTD